MPNTKTRNPLASKVYQQLNVNDMTAGLDLRQSPSQLDEARTRKLMNWSIAEPGALQVRSGYQQFSTVSLGAKRITGAHRIYLSSHTFTVAAYDGGVYKKTDTGAWGTSSNGPAVYSSISSANETHFGHDRDMVTFFDSTNQMFKSTNGSSWTQFGITPSTAKSTLSSAGGGDLLANEYEIGFTYESDFPFESNGGVISTYTMGSTGVLKVEVTGSTDPQVTKINFYARNKTAGETVRRKASSAANVSGSTVSVSISDSNWLSNLEEPQDHNVPEILAFGVVWKNRWWARDANIKNRLYFTQVFLSQAWPATFFIDIPFDSGDGIEALIALGDTLLVFGGTNIFVIFGQTSLDFEVRPALDAQDGALGPRAVAVIENGVLHAGSNGIYVFDGVSDRLLSFDIEPGWRDTIEKANATDNANVAVVYHQLTKEIRVAVPRLYPTAQRGEWVLDLSRTRLDNVPAWTQTDRNIYGYIHWDGAEASVGVRGRLQSWNDTNGIVTTESTGTTANSSDMVAEYEGPTFVGSPNRIRVIDTFGEYEPNSGIFSIDTEVDGKSMGARTIDIGAVGLPKYGEAEYGSTTYGTGTSRKRYFRMLPLRAEGRTFTRKFKYQGQSAFKTYTYGYSVIPETNPLCIED